MARKKNLPEAVHAKSTLAGRLRQIRQELFGDHGGPELARRLELPARTWYNYETGVTVPGEMLLRFLEVTAVEPRWLLDGHGTHFRTPAPAPEPLAATGDAEALLRLVLRRLERGTLRVTWEGPE